MLYDRLSFAFPFHFRNQWHLTALKQNFLYICIYICKFAWIYFKMSSTDRIVVADVLIYTPILVIEIYEILFWFCRSHIEAILCYGSEIRCISHCDFKFNIMCMVKDILMKFRRVSCMVYIEFFDYLALSHINILTNFA